MASALRTALFAAALLALGIPAANAVHLDIELRGDGDRLAVGFCLTAGVGCDLPGALRRLGLPAGTLPTDAASGYKVFAADFGDPLKPFETKNPGFNAVDNALIPKEVIRYVAQGRLLQWFPDRRQWGTAGTGVRVRLFGGIDARTAIRLDYSQCGGLLVCIPKEIQETVYEEGSTVFSADGIGGAASLLIADAKTKGSLHTHLDWFLENAAGTAGGPRGAYLATLQLRSDRRAQPSEPFLIVFNNGLSDEEFAEAIAARMAAVAPEPTPAPTPGPGPDTSPAPEPGPGPTPAPIPAPTPSPDAGPSPSPGPAGGPTPEPTASPAPQPDPSPTPAPVPTPGPTAASPLRSLAYRETGSEAIAGCRPECIKRMKGSTRIDLTIDAAALAEAARLELRIGTQALAAALDPATASRLAAGGLRKLSLRLQDGAGRAVGTLRLAGSPGQLRLRWQLPRSSLLAENFTGGLPGRTEGIESVTLLVFDRNGGVLARFETTLELAGTVTRRTLQRNGAAQKLDTVRLGGRGG
jgi:hypothetical protein